MQSGTSTIFLLAFAKTEFISSYVLPGPSADRVIWALVEIDRNIKIFKKMDWYFITCKLVNQFGLPKKYKIIQ